MEEPSTSSNSSEALDSMCNRVAKKFAAITSAANPIEVDHDFGGTYTALPIPVDVCDEVLEELNKMDRALREALAFMAEELKMPEVAAAIKDST